MAFSTYGPVFNFSNVERWILSLAEDTFKNYLAQACRDSGEDPTKFSDLASLVTANEWDNWPEEVIPCLLVIDLGLGGEPSRYGNGQWRVRRLFGASVIVSSHESRSDAKWVSGIYMAAFRTMMLQNQDLRQPLHIAGMDWTDERPAPVLSSDERTVQAQNALFYIDVMNVVDEGGRYDPSDPDGQPDDPNIPPDPPPVVADPTPDDPEIPPGGSSITIRTRSIT